MDEESIVEIFKQTVNNEDYSSNSLGKAVLDMKIQGDVGNLFQKNKRRRSKKDKTGRVYFCGCGKDYLSYPALYTHIKNKHGGVPPEGTTKQHHTRVRPGRPPKSKLLNSGSKTGKGDDSNSVSRLTMREDDDNDVNDDNQSQLQSVDGDFSPLKQSRMEDFRRKKLLHLDNFDLIDKIGCRGESSPTHSFTKKRNAITNQFILHPLVEILGLLRFNQVSEDFYDILTCDKIFSIFLLKLSKISTPILYAYISMVIRALRTCLNSFGYELLDIYDRQNERQKIELLRENEDTDANTKGEFTVSEPTWYISLVFDFFLKEFFPKYLDTYDFNFDLVADFLIAFNKWLIENNLSRIGCSYNNRI